MEVSGRKQEEFNARFFWPPVPLSRYFFAFVLTESNPPDGMHHSDIYVPAWGFVSWRDRPNVSVHYQSGETINAGKMTAMGVFDHTVKMEFGPLRQWTAVLMPAAWDRFISGSARDFANRTVDVEDDSRFSNFHGLDSSLFNGRPDCDAELAAIYEHLKPVAQQVSHPNEERIDKILDALMSANISNVGDMSDYVQVTRRTLERCCDQTFGLPPKTLIRRQRFLRSLAKHMLDREASWTDAMDYSYHDQPQFVREFRQFTEMSPSEYAQLDRPMADPGMINSLRYWREAEQLTG